MAKNDLTNLKESRSFLREMNIEMDRYKSGVKDATSLAGKLTEDTESTVKAAIALRETNNLSAKGLSDIVELGKKIQNNSIDDTEASRLKKDLQEQLNIAIEKGFTKSADALQTQVNMIDGLKTRLTTEKTVSASIKQQEQLLSGIDDITGGLASKAKAFGEALKSPIVGTFAVIALIVGLLSQIAEQTDMIGNKFGSIGTTKFRSDLVGATAAAQKLGFGFEEVAGSTLELSNNFGMAFEDAVKLSTSTMDTARALGINVDEASKLTGMLMSISGHSETSAQNFLKQADALAISAGVAPGVVLQDMASSSEQVAKFTIGTGENMIKASIAARQMGMSLADVSGIAENLLEFQSSIQSEMEAQAILGRDINLTRARELALSGDLAGMQQEILNVVGSETEFNKLNVIQRKALAGALGLEVSQLAKMVSHAGKSRKELMAMADVDISQIASEKAIGEMTKFTNEMRAASTQLIGLIAGISNLGGVFGDLSAGQKLTNIILIGLLGSLAMYAIKTGIQIGLNTLLIGSEQKLNKVRSTGQSRGLFERVFGKNTKPSRILAGSIALVIMSGALVLAAVAFQQFGDVTWASVAKGLIVLGGLTLSAMLMGKVSKDIILGAVAIAILGAALIPAAYAFSLLAGVDPMSIIAFAGALVVLGLAAFALGATLFTGVGALIFGAGILGLIALGGAILILGLAMAVAMPQLDGFNNFIGNLSTTMSQIVPQIDGINMLASALTNLGTSLMMVGMGGLAALPVLAGLSAVAPILEMLGIGGGSDEGSSAGESEFNAMKVSLKNVEDKMSKLVAGFQDGTFAELIGSATGRNTGKISAEIKPSLI